MMMVSREDIETLVAAIIVMLVVVAIDVLVLSAAAAFAEKIEGSDGDDIIVGNTFEGVSGMV
jgi:hypothetical protein